MRKSDRKLRRFTKNVQNDRKNEINWTKKVIIDTYFKAGKTVENSIKKHNKNTFTENDLKKLQKKLNKEIKRDSSEIKKAIEIAVFEMVDKTLEQNLDFYKNIDKKYGTNLHSFFIKKYKGIKDVVQKAVLGGTMYKDKHSLADRVYKDLKKNQASINFIIQQGLRDNEHPLDIAKKLEKFVKPNMAKDFNWSKVYPGSKNKIEYNSIRLARTSINHAYHQATIEAAKRNPLVSKVEWLSANSHGRTCEMCSNRDGKIYDIDKVPEDHPNGMCMILEVLPSDKALNKILDNYLESDYNDFDEFMSSYESDDE